MSKAVIKLAKKHGDDPFNVRDEALIAFAGLAYFSGHDLSLVTVSDVITERSKIVIDNYLPGSVSSNGKARMFYIDKKTYFQDVTVRVIEWRIKNKLGCLDRGLFAGLNPDSKFFLKDDGSEYGLNFKNRHEGDTVTQTLQMQRKFKSIYLPEAVSLTTLMDSFIECFWLKKSSEGTVQAIRDLVELTRLSKETLRVKCIREQTSLQDILENLY